VQGTTLDAQSWNIRLTRIQRMGVLIALRRSHEDT
jgi:hypothetical protein